MKQLLGICVFLVFLVACSTVDPNSGNSVKPQVKAVAESKLIEANAAYNELKSMGADTKYPSKFKSLTKLLAEARTLEEIKAYDSLQKILQDYFKSVETLKEMLSQKTAYKPEINKETVQAKTENKAQTIHTVKSGDTLYGLARTYYKDASKWFLIYEANKNKISNAREINVGQKLIIPSEEN